MKTYITRRGVKTTLRPYRELSLEEREQIIRDNLVVGSLATREKWNISTDTLAHVMYHYKPLVELIEEEHFQKAGL